MRARIDVSMIDGVTHNGARVGAVDGSGGGGGGGDGADTTTALAARFQMRLKVVEQSAVHMIVGMDVLLSNRCTLDLGRSILVMNPPDEQGTRRECRVPLLMRTDRPPPISALANG